MKTYKKLYFNWMITIVWVIVITHITLGYAFQWGYNHIDTAGYVIFLILFIGIYTAMYSLRITIDDKKMVLTFGIGMIKKIIFIAHINEVNLIENKYKYSPKKSGLKDFRSYQWPTLNKQAVEIKLVNKTGIIIGTKNPDELLNELKKRMTKQSNAVVNII